MGMGMNNWEWEEMGLKKQTFPLISTWKLEPDYSLPQNLYNSIDAVSGGCCDQFKRERGGTQCFGDRSDDLLWIRRMLVTQRDFLRFGYRRRTPDGLLGLVLPLHRGAGAAQQLRQSFHLRRQVS